jgi:hypothetical protein
MRKHNSRRKKRKVFSHRACTGNATRIGGKLVERSDDPNFADAFGTEAPTRQKMEVSAEDGKLIITLPRFDPPTRSRSGKSFLIATTGGVKRSSFFVDGSPVQVVASAFIYDDGGEPPVKWQPLFELQKNDDDEDDPREWDDVEELA